MLCFEANKKGQSAEYVRRKLSICGHLVQMSKPFNTITE
jgi:hypothetical protein